VTSTARRLVLVSTAAAAALVLTAGPALAHVEVEVAPARALATDALLSLTAEAESGTAGISGLRIQLPAGLVPGDLRLASGPTGWRLAGSGDVVTVSGPALPVGRSLRFGIRVRQLPDGRQLVLKTVQSYTDGKQDVDRAADGVGAGAGPAGAGRAVAGGGAGGDRGAAGGADHRGGPDHLRGRADHAAGVGHRPFSGGCARRGRGG